MIIQQSMFEVVFRSKLEKGIYHFDCVVQHIDKEMLQNVIAGTVIVKIRNGEIYTYDYFNNYICKNLGSADIRHLSKTEAVKRAQEIEKFITN